jgi:antitoxin CptB
MNNDIDNLKKKLIYRSQYRGTKEMDKLIASFVRIHIERFDVNELKELEKLLNTDDDTLYKFYNNQLKKVDFVESRILKLFKSFEYKN